MPVIPIDMTAVWQANTAFLELARDREILGHLLADVAGPQVAAAHGSEGTKLIKVLIQDCLSGENGRAKVETWVPRWMAFPPSAYTVRGGVGSVERHLRLASQARANAPFEPLEGAGNGEVPLAA